MWAYSDMGGDDALSQKSQRSLQPVPPYGPEAGGVRWRVYSYESASYEEQSSMQVTPEEGGARRQGESGAGPVPRPPTEKEEEGKGRQAEQRVEQEEMEEEGGDGDREVVDGEVEILAQLKRALERDKAEAGAWKQTWDADGRPLFTNEHTQVRTYTKPSILSQVEQHDERIREMEAAQRW